VKVSIISLTCCAGCVSSFLNAGEALLEILLDDFQIAYSPTFMDLKEIPEVDLAIVEGGVRTQADEKLIKEVRAKSKILVALGICATHSEITSLGNMFSLKKLLERDYSVFDSSKLPELEDLMYPICNFVDVDYYIPRCPPMPFLIVHNLKSVASGKTPIRHQSVVCTECHRRIVSSRLDRLYGIYEKEADRSLCLVSQGFVCLGSLTRALFSAALSALDSWKNIKTELNRIMVKMTAELVTSPKAADTIPAKSRIRTRGFLNCKRNLTIEVLFSFFATSLRP